MQLVVVVVAATDLARVLPQLILVMADPQVVLVAQALQAHLE